MNNILLKPLFEKKADPLTLLLRDIFKDNKYAMSYLGALSIGLGFSQINTLSAEETDSTVEEIIVTGSKPLSIQDFDNEVKKGALILDVRHQKDFVKGFIPGSWFIGIDGGFAPWVGSLIKDINQKIVIIFF